LTELVGPVEKGAPRDRGQLNRMRPRLAFTGVSIRCVLLVFAAIVLVAFLAPVLGLADPAAQSLLLALHGPSGAHWLGTDQLGRDILSRLVWGTRTTILAAALATAIAGAIGVPLGLLAAYRRGVVESVINRFADGVLTLPALVLLLAIQAAIQAGIYTSMAILGAVTSPQIYRVVRSATLAVSKKSFVEAGRLSGASHVAILGRYLLPNVREQIIVQLSYILGFGLMVESGMSFLGVGVHPPNPSLGTMLSDGVAVLGRDSNLVLIAGAVLSFLILACNVLGDAMAEAGLGE
jgi:peptide/nickel transport system permease protein